MTRLWDKGAPLDERVLRYSAGEDHALDERLVPYDVRASLAHAAMLHAQGLLAAKRPGSIINVSSQMGLVGGGGRSLYSASKFALEGLTKCMAIDLAPHGIRVNTLCPTFIETALTRPVLDMPGTREHVLSRIKLGRLGRLEELSGALLLLASDASTLMTGSALVVDGGWTAE